MFNFFILIAAGLVCVYGLGSESAGSGRSMFVWLVEVKNGNRAYLRGRKHEDGNQTYWSASRAGVVRIALLSTILSTNHIDTIPAHHPTTSDPGGEEGGGFCISKNSDPLRNLLIHETRVWLAYFSTVLVLVARLGC